MSESVTAGDKDATRIPELLRQRETVQAWLERLDQVGAEVSERVRARVRADYQARLQETLAALAAHEAALRAELEQQRERLREAEQEYELALDTLEEQRLRQRLGELGEEEWETRRATLEGAVTQADWLRDQAWSESARLEEILAQIAPAPLETRAEEPAAAEPEPEAEAQTAEEATGAERDEPAEEAEIGEEPLAGWDALEIGRDEDDEEWNTLPSPAPGDPRDDVAFLEELDRAIASSGPTRAAEPARPAWSDDEPNPAAAPGPGLKCPECGYTNDPTAWYCGVCGADLA